MISPGRVIRENRNGRAAWVLDRDSRTLPDFGRLRAKSGGVLQGQGCRSLHRLPLSAPSMITYSCAHPLGFWATKQTAGI